MYVVNLFRYRVFVTITFYGILRCVHSLMSGNSTILRKMKDEGGISFQLNAGDIISCQRKIICLYAPKLTITEIRT